jgi:hypothetical protein
MTSADTARWSVGETTRNAFIRRPMQPRSYQDTTLMLMLVGFHFAGKPGYDGCDFCPND